MVHGIIGNPGEFGSTDCAGVTQLAHLLTPVIKPPSATSENQRAVRGQFPVRSFGHEKSAPLAVMFNPT